MISNEAVEAATAAIDTCGCESPEWLARLALEAAAPHMRAQFVMESEQQRMIANYERTAK